MPERFDLFGKALPGKSGYTIADAIFLKPVELARRLRNLPDDARIIGFMPDGFFYAQAKTGNEVDADYCYEGDTIFIRCSDGSYDPVMRLGEWDGKPWWLRP